MPNVFVIRGVSVERCWLGFKRVEVHLFELVLDRVEVDDARLINLLLDGSLLQFLLLQC